MQKKCIFCLPGGAAVLIRSVIWQLLHGLSFPTRLKLGFWGLGGIEPTAIC